jgi:hypothetical protein
LVAEYLFSQGYLLSDLKQLPVQVAKHLMTKAIYEAGGTILSLGTALGENSENREVMVKVANVDRQTLVSAIEPLVERILDVRELASG